MSIGHTSVTVLAVGKEMKEIEQLPSFTSRAEGIKDNKKGSVDAALPDALVANGQAQ